MEPWSQAIADGVKILPQQYGQAGDRRAKSTAIRGCVNTFIRVLSNTRFPPSITEPASSYTNFKNLIEHRFVAGLWKPGNAWNSCLLTTCSLAVCGKLWTGINSAKATQGGLDSSDIRYFETFGGKASKFFVET